MTFYRLFHPVSACLVCAGDGYVHHTTPCIHKGQITRKPCPACLGATYSVYVEKSGFIRKWRAA